MRTIEQYDRWRPRAWCAVCQPAGAERRLAWLATREHAERWLWSCRVGPSGYTHDHYHAHPTECVYTPGMGFVEYCMAMRPYRWFDMLYPFDRETAIEWFAAASGSRAQLSRVRSVGGSRKRRMSASGGYIVQFVRDGRVINRVRLLPGHINPVCFE